MSFKEFLLTMPNVGKDADFERSKDHGRDVGLEDFATPDLEDNPEPGEPSIPGWHRDIIRERLAEDDRDPEGALPGEDLITWLRQPRA